MNTSDATSRDGDERFDDTGRTLFDAAMHAAGVRVPADRIAGVYANVAEMRRLAAIVRGAVDDETEPAAVFRPMPTRQNDGVST